MYKIIQVSTTQKWWQDAKKLPPLGNSKDEDFYFFL